MKRTLLMALAAGILTIGALPAQAQEIQAQETRDEPAPPTEPTGIEPMPAEMALYVEQAQVFVDGKAVELAPAGKEVTVKITVRNGGEKAATDVVLTLERTGEGITVADGRATYGDLAAGDSATRSYAMTVAETDCTEFAGVAATITSSLGETPTKLGFGVACPGPRVHFENVRYAGGDGDQLPEAGEKLDLFVSLRNQGRDAATAVRGTLTIDNADIKVIDGSASWPDIPSSEARENATPMVIEIADNAETAAPCEPFTDGGIVIEDKPASDDPVSSGGTVSSDGTDPVGQEEPGSTGSGSAGSSGTSEPNEGSGTSTGTITVEPATTTSTVEPDSTVEPEPDGEPVPEPGTTDEGTPALFEARLTVTASGTQFDQAFGSGAMCALAEGRPAGGAGTTPDGAEPAAARNAFDESAAGVTSKTPAGAGAMAGVLLATVAALALRFRFSL